MGNTLILGFIVKEVQDHPHIHGEYSCFSGLKSKIGGSPPHTWGIQIGGRNMLLHGRITPTYMGNTAIASNLSPSSKDHPHIHGEYIPALKFPKSPLGSPPHTWGILQRGGNKMRGFRITPTYMGNTGKFE